MRQILRPAITLCLLSTVGCGQPSLTHSNAIIPTLLFSDPGGAPITTTTPDPTLVDKVAGTLHVPVVAPDQHDVTWGEFRQAGGVAQVSCTGSGTHVHIDFQHLLPNAVYTGWLVFFQPPGFAAQQFDAMTGLAPIGPQDGSQARLVTDAHGSAVLDALTPSGQATVLAPGRTQQIPSCLLDLYEVHLVAAYHIDGQTHGSEPGDPSTIAEQVGWMIEQGKAAP